MPFTNKLWADRSLRNLKREMESVFEKERQRKRERECVGVCVCVYVCVSERGRMHATRDN